MLNYNKNKLINNCLHKYYETFAQTLDTTDFVPDEYNDKITKYIFKNMNIIRQAIIFFNAFSKKQNIASP